MPDFEFRRVASPDVTFCWPIYREAVQPLVAELRGWNEATERRAIEEALADAGASILVEAERDAGWLHVDETRFEIHLGHLYLAPAARNRGLGSRFMQWMNERARRKNKTFTLDVLKNSRARRLFERLGFRAIGTSADKIKMRLQDKA